MSSGARVPPRNRDQLHVDQTVTSYASRTLAGEPLVILQVESARGATDRENDPTGVEVHLDADDVADLQNAMTSAWRRLVQSPGTQRVLCLRVLGGHPWTEGEG